MSDDQAKHLDAFSGWLRTLGEDAAQLSAVLQVEGASAQAREAVAGGLNYLFKSLDLIPDGIDDIGYLDDAFVLRVAARTASEGGELGDAAAAVERLSAESRQVEAFLDESYARLERYVDGLRAGAARGRTVREVLADEAKLEEFLAEVKGFNASYEPPSFSRDEKILIKLRAFFDAKLPK